MRGGHCIHAAPTEPARFGNLPLSEDCVALRGCVPDVPKRLQMSRGVNTGTFIAETLFRHVYGFACVDHDIFQGSLDIAGEELNALSSSPSSTDYLHQSYRMPPSPNLLFGSCVIRCWWPGGWVGGCMGEQAYMRALKRLKEQLRNWREASGGGFDPSLLSDIAREVRRL